MTSWWIVGSDLPIWSELFGHLLVRLSIPLPNCSLEHLVLVSLPGSEKLKWYHWRRGGESLELSAHRELWVMECRLLTPFPFHSCCCRSTSDQEETRWVFKAVLKHPGHTSSFASCFLQCCCSHSPSYQPSPSSPFPDHHPSSIHCPPSSFSEVPLTGAVALLSLWQVPLWVIPRWLTLVSLSPPPASCQNQPSTQPPGQENHSKSYLFQNEAARLSTRAVTLNEGTQGIWEWCNWNQMERPEIP